MKAEADKQRAHEKESRENLKRVSKAFACYEKETREAKRATKSTMDKISALIEKTESLTGDGSLVKKLERKLEEELKEQKAVLERCNTLAGLVHVLNRTNFPLELTRVSIPAL